MSTILKRPMREKGKEKERDRETEKDRNRVLSRRRISMLWTVLRVETEISGASG